MIPSIEKEIFIKINYTDKYLNIVNKYLNKGVEVPLFRKEEVKKQFDELGLKYSNKNSSYSISRIHNNFKFVFRFMIRRNITEIYMNIYENNEILDNRVSNMGSILRYIPYDAEKANVINAIGFNINDENELKAYIKDMYELFSEFVDEYINKL